MLSTSAVNKVIFHVDVDAFYASVEQMDNPSLKGKPVIVGALPGRRGVVSACSYEARRSGIHSAMPVSQAYRLCPQGIFLPVRMKRYGEVSRKIMEILGAFTPEFRQLSIDEAYLDLTGTRRLFGSPMEVARRIKEEVNKACDLTISIGIADNGYLAKLASEAGKPDGLVLVEEENKEPFLDTLRLDQLWGVGEKTLARLHELNITDMPRLRAFSSDLLGSLMGKAAGRFLYNAARGTDPGIHPTETKSHSLSSEVTFERDRRDRESLTRVLLETAQQIIERLIVGEKRARTVFIKLRYSDFTTVTARKTVKHWIASTEQMYRLALDLLDTKWDGHSAIRLIGLGVAGVVKDPLPLQVELFEDPEEKRMRVEETVTRLKKKIGGEKLTRASLLRKKHPF
jgi:DNA polymerase-4